MTSREFLSELLSAADHQTEEDLPYIAVTEPGDKVFRALLAGHSADPFFAVVERVFAEGDAEAQNLCVVGLFESLQGRNYREGDADLVERHLGPLSQAAWADLIEGWTGAGYRTVAQWRAKPPKP